MLQSFFCVDANTGQPLLFINGSSGKKCASATIDLMERIKKTGLKKGLFVADKEHFTSEIAEWFVQHKEYEILMPAPDFKNHRCV
ncbi:MAG: hypothetical protein IPO63_15680 [Bacteroidetes bacterium]|nr:hypothetical protein [Bacteroidota bacterium]